MYFYQNCFWALQVIIQTCIRLKVINSLFHSNINAFINSFVNIIGFGNTSTSNVFGAQNSIFGKPQQTTPAFGTQPSTQPFGMNTTQPNIFGSNTAQTAKPFGGNF